MRRRMVPLPLHCFPSTRSTPSLTPSPCVGSLTWPAVHQGAPHSHRLWLPALLLLHSRSTATAPIQKYVIDTVDAQLQP
uniref:Uncharacterized protein n=1 Tax=Oryza nivara TaxID=4536 RepID=A0A0E0FJ51_ORYNI